MKTRLIALFLLGFTVFSSGQENEDYLSGEGYMSIEGEMIFSFANIESPEGVNVDQNLRWSPVFNITWHYNYDVSNNFGLNVGLGIRNVGFIAKGDVYGNDENIDRIKYRTYNAGIPIGIKIGDLNQKQPFFLFGGYEFELPFHYKEKQFDGNNKEDKSTGWFSNKTNDFQQSVFAGLQFPNGFSLKFKYYLTEFFDSDYSERTDVEGQEGVVRPFEDFNANVFYFSIEWYPFQSVDYAVKSFEQ